MLFIMLCLILPAAQADLLVRYSFDTGPGDVVVDDTGHGYDGVLVVDTQWQEGGYDGSGFAGAFTGGSSVENEPIADALNGLDALTAMVWIKSDIAGTENGFINFSEPDNGDTGGMRYDVATWAWAGGSNAITAVTPNTGGRARIESSSGLQVTEWQHVAMVWASGEPIRLYVDGVEDTHPTGVDAGVSGTVSGVVKLVVGRCAKNNAAGSSWEGLIDEVRLYSNALTEAEVQAAMFDSGAKGRAGNPEPADGATDILRDTLLTWSAGEYAAGHEIYLGTSYDDVNSAGVDSPLYLGRQTENSYDPGRLVLGQTYFWRIDEVNSPPDSTVYGGEVWSFTVEPVSYALPIGAVSAAATSAEPPQDPNNTVNGSGLNENDLHTILQEHMWLAESTDPTPSIEFTFSKIEKLDKLRVWNHNTQAEGVLGFGIKEALIEYSSDGETWDALGTVELAQASGTSAYAGIDVPLQGILAHHVRITGRSNYSMLGLPQMGLSEVRFYAIPVLARAPDPADGGTSDGVDVTLQWRPGREAREHEVVFSDDEQDVIDGSAVVATVSASAHDLGTLDLGRTYFWKINEMNDLGTPPVYEGDLWTFSTPDHRMVDDFEMYRAQEGLRIWEYWIDGFDHPGDNGAVVGNGDDAEKSVVYEGSQSMPITFNNTAAPASEVTRYFDTPVDLTRGNPASLKLQVRGDAPGFVDNGDGTYTVGAAGADIWGTADDFRFVYKRLSGDGSITARVDSCTQANVWTKAGIMIRENLGADTTNAYSFVTPTGRVGTQWRTDTFGSTVSTRSETEGEIALPTWVRLTRSGNLFRGEQSADGVTWQPMFQSGTPTLPTEMEILMIPDVYIGLAVTSHEVGVPATAKFSNVSTTGNVTGSWISEAIGADTHPDNDAAPMYLMVADTTGKEVRIEHPDPAATVLTRWDEWTIPLGDLDAVNTTRIDSITVGVGSSGVQGKVYIDAIRTERPYPVLE
jgi:hypothetical protein